MKHAYNARSMAGYSTVKLGNVWVFFWINLDHDGKPVMTKSIEYNDDFGSKDCTKVNWKEGKDYVKQRKYVTKEINTFIYVWIHSDP